jgi:CxxC motif-containing protein (DUF1111 family)/cytochrome c553
MATSGRTSGKSPWIAALATFVSAALAMSACTGQMDRPSTGSGSSTVPGQGGPMTQPPPTSIEPLPGGTVIPVGSTPPDSCNRALPSAYVSNCSACHTQNGQANVRYPDLYKFMGTLTDFTKQVRMGGKVMAAYPPTLISDADVGAIFDYFTKGNTRQGLDTIALGDVQPLFTMADAKNPPITYKRDDGVLITRGAGRVRGRHEKEGSFGQFLVHYFQDRSFGFTIEDFTVAGTQRIRTTYLPIYMPGQPQTNWRVWKMQGNNATFIENHFMNDITEAPVMPMGPVGRPQQFDQTTIPAGRAMAVGQNFEFEFGVFIAAGSLQTPGSRTAYYSDTFRYQIGVGGMTPNNLDYTVSPGPLPDARLGGDTTIAWMFAEPETAFGQMALNTQQENVQNFLEGRRLFHTDFVTGEHSDPGNPVFTEQVGKAGPLFNTTSCENCHINNGPGALLEGPLGVKTSMAFKLYGAGSLGNQLQLQEGSASVSGFDMKTVMLGDGTPVTLRKPNFALTAMTGGVANYSARLARKLVGLGLLEAIDERTILARADRLDCDKDGISGRPNFVKDPVGGALRVGRFGWKAEKVSVAHQIADAADADMGVGTSIIPDSTGKAELSDADLMKLTTYMRLIGVPGQRTADDPQVQHGGQIFKTVGCANCHVTDVVTSGNHPFSELRSQAIKPYTDLLLHDMGADLADQSGIAYVDTSNAPAAASEWRTPPLWGIGLYKTINGHTGLLHDGRAADVQEAVLWHGGEAETIKGRFIALPAADRAALLAFVQSL